MRLSEEEKKYTLNEYLRNISHLQDKEYQTRIWIKGEGPECQAFDDAVCDFFDIGDPILQEYRDFGITEIQYKTLKKLRDDFRIFAFENDSPEEFIDNPEWAKLMNSAKDVLKAFNYQSENKKQIMQTFIRIMEHLSDKEYQKRTWIMGEGPEVDDFDETACHFFQEADGIIEEYKDFGLTEHQYKQLKKFREHFKEFSDEYDLPEEFIDTPEWAKIVDSAKEVLKAFNYQNESKKQILQSFLETIGGISDQKYQEQVWILGEESEYDNFTETICHLFEEVNGILEKYNDFGISNKQYELLIEFRNQLDKFVKRPRPGSIPQEFIDTDTPEWGKITEMAKEILKSFNYKKSRQ